MAVSKDICLTDQRCFKVKSKKNELSENSSCRCALDGSVCFCTVLSCLQNDVPVKISQNSCPVCVQCNDNFCVAIQLYNGAQFKLCLGQSPDLCGTDPNLDNTQLNLRQLLERTFYRCQTGDCFNLEVDEFVNNELVKSFNLTLRVDLVQLTPFESLSDKWNPQIELYWANRAISLKRRGTHIVRTHSECCKNAWFFAFQCYSRALQLGSLAYWSSRSCQTKSGDDDDGVHKESLTSETNLDGYVDLDKLVDDEKIKLKSEDNYVRLQFMLLLNLSLCQAKFVSHDFAVQNCTQALKLVDLDCQKNPCLRSELIELCSQCEKDFSITLEDFAKVYYRRAQSLKALGSMEEAKIDLELCIELQTNQLQSPLSGRTEIEHALNASKTLLGQVLEYLERDKAKLMDRLRKRVQNY